MDESIRRRLNSHKKIISTSYLLALVSDLLIRDDNARKGIVCNYIEQSMAAPAASDKVVLPEVTLLLSADVAFYTYILGLGKEGISSKY